MIVDRIGYIILENQVVEPHVNIVAEKNHKIVANAILQTADERNRNGRFYEHTELFPQLTCPRTMELLHARAMKGELGHPLSKDLQRQTVIDDTRTCVVYNKFWTEGMNVMGEFTTTNNEFGKALDQDIREGYIPAFSLRALGSVQQTRRGAEVKGLRLITYDQVIYPSHVNAYMTQIISENTNMIDLNEDAGFDTDNKARIIPITNTSVINFIQAQSSNLKFVRENFDFAYDSIAMNENGSKVLLTTKQGDTLVINLERYVHNEIMNYADGLNRFKN